jgi:dUTPase
MPSAILKVWIDDDKEHDAIITHIEAHNAALLDSHPNSGFDLLVPENVWFKETIEGKLINHGIKCAMYYNGEKTPCAFLLAPRSSIYKTPLILANSIGIIDAGYRGYICSALRSFTQDYMVLSGARITQLCHPTMCPIVVKIVDTEEELGAPTTRGSGGFGSTGGEARAAAPARSANGENVRACKRGDTIM